MPEKVSTHDCKYDKEIIVNGERVNRIISDQEKILQALSDVKDKAFSNNNKVSTDITILNSQYVTLTDILRANTTTSNKMAEGLTKINVCILAIDKKIDSIENNLGILHSSHNSLTSEVSNLKANIYPRLSKIEKVRISILAGILAVSATVTVILNLDNLYSILIKHKKPVAAIEKVEAQGNDTDVSK